jgi:hypothetical protein
VQFSPHLRQYAGSRWVFRLFGKGKKKKLSLKAKKRGGQEKTAEGGKEKEGGIFDFAERKRI